ncbi:hypothetical protein SAY86_010555 [Trapa natans]|uniref:Uncharacterized protein n=1 Tax=Trapa natans TaxID=22666 RepID=A0AAN7R1Y8_TRANT|nr:hypothetical protein SAY86_010555 [Trapa natans]
MQDIVIRNLDYIFAVSSQSIASASPEILANLEKLLDSRSSEPWSSRRLPRPTAVFPTILDSEEEDCENGLIRTRSIKKCFPVNSTQNIDSFLRPKLDLNEGISKEMDHHSKSAKRKKTRMKTALDSYELASDFH